MALTLMAVLSVPPLEEPPHAHSPPSDLRVDGHKAARSSRGLDRSTRAEKPPKSGPTHTGHNFGAPRTSEASRGRSFGPLQHPSSRVTVVRAPVRSQKPACHGGCRLVRLQSGVPVAGLDPDVARDLARACNTYRSNAATVAHLVHRPERTVRKELQQLAAAGFLDQQRDREGMNWLTTIAGNALAMASFLKPIPRAKADKLLAQVLSRATAYNADETKPRLISEIRVFGSYLDPVIEVLGDLDLFLAMAERPGVDAMAYSQASGRTFNTFYDQLTWPDLEVIRILKNRSPYISVHTEDISRFTNDWRVIFPP